MSCMQCSGLQCCSSVPSRLHAARHADDPCAHADRRRNKKQYVVASFKHRGCLCLQGPQQRANCAGLLAHAQKRKAAVAYLSVAFWSLTVANLLSCRADKSGYLIGSIEGRVAVHHVEEANQSKNFTFKCHRCVFAAVAVCWGWQAWLLKGSAPGACAIPRSCWLQCALHPLRPVHGWLSTTIAMAHSPL